MSTGLFLYLRSVLLTVLCCALPVYAWAQKKDVRFKHLGIEQGLSQSAVVGVAQDTLGFMWFATHDGLNRYDGYEFDVYRQSIGDTNSLAANNVGCIKVDSKGRFWIGTLGGGLQLYNYNRDNFINWPITTGKADAKWSYIKTIYEDHVGNLWIGTKAGLVKLDPMGRVIDTFKGNTANSKMLFEDGIEALLDYGGKLWIATTEHGLCSMDLATKTVQRYPWQTDTASLHGALMGYYLNNLLVVNNNVWACGPFGLNIVDPKTGKSRYKRLMPVANQIPTHLLQSDLQLGPDSTIYVSFLDFGFGKLDTTTWLTDTYLHDPLDPSSISSDLVNVFFFDRSGNCWIAMNGSGLNVMVAKPKFDRYKYGPIEENCLPIKSIRAILKTSNGDLYVGGYYGLAVYKANGERKYYQELPTPPRKMLLNRSVYSLCENVDGKIWIGTEGGGLQLFDPATGKNEYWDNTSLDDKRRIPSLAIYKLFKDKDGTLWIGTGKGLARYDAVKNEMTSYLQDDKSDNGGLKVRDIINDNDNYLWVATESGLVHFEKATGKYKLYNYQKGNPNCLPNDVLKCIYKDANNNLWVATEGSGLAKLVFNKQLDIVYIQRFGTGEGLPSDVVYGILPDKAGNLWLSTNNGICKLNQQGGIQSFGMADGVQSTEFNTAAYYEAPDGEMFFGGINGLNSFYPDKISYNTVPPKVVITSFKVLNKEYNLDTAIWASKEITISATSDFFSFEFAALDYTAPERNEYAYQLEGFDKDWIKTGNRRYAAYTNLPPGHYTFRVKASNNDGVWNDNGTSVQITIVPPFWRNKWFIILLVLIFIVVVTLVLRYRINRLQEQQKFLEDKVKMQSEKLKMERLKAEIAISKALIDGQNIEQKRISEDLHDGLGQTLTAASLNLMALENDLNEAGITNSDKVDSLKSLLQNAIVEVRNISHNLMPNLMAEEGLEAAITELCNRTIKSSKLDIILKIQNLPKKLNSAIEISFYRIVQEVINNTLKHSGARKLFVSIIYFDNRIMLETEDNGVGFDPNIKDIKGLGLKNIAIRVEMLNGVYHINSVPGKGTLISIEIPVS